MAKRIIVIGAGLIGVSAALRLQDEGHKVRVIDREGVAAGASQGNAAAFAFPDVIPLATPGIMKKAPKWLLDPLGPLAIPPAYALQITPWMLRFWRASWRDRYRAARAAQTALMAHCAQALERQVKDVEGEHFMRREGQLVLYEGERAFVQSLPEWEYRRDHGIGFEHLTSPEAIAELQPGLSPRFTHAGFTPSWSNTINPKSWTEHLAQQFLVRGGEIARVPATALRATEKGVEITTASGLELADLAVVSAGAWSHHLARTLGDRIPLETERGYNTTFARSNVTLNTFLSFNGHGFVISKIDEGLRVGGAVELGGLNLPPNYKRADHLLAKAKQFFPALAAEGGAEEGAQWMGFRPSMPDSLPVIDRSPKTAHVIYAFGHGHLGLTQSAGTGELVADLVAEREGSRGSGIDMLPFGATRFV